MQKRRLCTLPWSHPQLIVLRLAKSLVRLLLMPCSLLNYQSIIGMVIISKVAVVDYVDCFVNQLSVLQHWDSVPPLATAIWVIKVVLSMMLLGHYQRIQE